MILFNLLPHTRLKVALLVLTEEVKEVAAFSIVADGPTVFNSVSCMAVQAGLSITGLGLVQASTGDTSMLRLSLYSSF